MYQELSNKFQIPTRNNHLIEEIEGRKIRLAADIICGRKQTTDFHNNDYEKWRKDYELVRSNLNLHFLWPKHKAPTINTYRYTKYLDRIDYLLFVLPRWVIIARIGLRLLASSLERELPKHQEQGLIIS